RWREALENKGLRVRLDTYDATSGTGTTEEAEIRIGERILQPNESFRYLGSVIQKSEMIEDDGGDLTIHVVRVRWLAVNKDSRKYDGSRRNKDAKMRECRLRWFGHVKRRTHSALVRRVESITVEDLGRWGRPKFRWEDRLKINLEGVLLSDDMSSIRNS
ncbi:hypothetical protein Tco_1443270, partial [Tanacetum coccineum]